MKLNDDLTTPAFVKREESYWVASPEPGINRLMLERIGGEKATRATTLVRYKEGSKFSNHIHTGGEEFLVLCGTFSDQTGNYSKGFYVRNPVGSSHAPWSDEGTTIFVKLGQIKIADQAYVRIDTCGSDWLHYPKCGVKILPLHRFEKECVRLISLLPHGELTEHDFPDGAEIFVTSGTLIVSGKELKQNDWLREPKGSKLSISSEKGATFYFKTGHLD